MTAAQSALIGDLLESVEMRPAIDAAIQAECQDLAAKMRSLARSEMWADVSRTEARITQLEEFFDMLIRRIHYQRPDPL